MLLFLYHNILPKYLMCFLILFHKCWWILYHLLWSDFVEDSAFGGDQILIFDFLKNIFLFIYKLFLCEHIQKNLQI